MALKPREFWSMTNREFTAYHKAWTKQKEEDNYVENHRLATLMAHLCNINSGKGGKKYKAEDFLPNPEKKKQKMNVNMMAEMLKAITLANGGEVKGG